MLEGYVVELIFGLISAGLVGFCTYLFKQKKELEKLQKQNENLQYRKMLLDEIEPLQEELRRVEAHINQVDMNMQTAAKNEHELMYKDLHTIQENNDKNFALIINSYKYRLIQLCKTHLHDGYITSDDFDQITQMYNLYHSLGGNGQAEDYYNKVKELKVNDKNGEDN